VIVAIAGPNGPGKTTFFEAFIKPAGLRFVNADIISRQLGLDPYAAAQVADAIRRQMASTRESFAFETVFSDPVGYKVTFLRQAADTGYSVVVCFIGLDSPKTSDDRVAMRVSQGGHDVPVNKLKERFPRTLTNLSRAIRSLPAVYIYDNSDLDRPFQLLGICRNGKLQKMVQPLPGWVPDDL